MAHTFKFALIRVTPDVRRGETVNVGVVVLGPDGPDVRLLPSMEKVHALDAGFEASAIGEVPQIIEMWASDSWGKDGGFGFFGEFGPVTISECGAFVAHTAKEYEREIDALMESLVSPPKVKKVKQLRRSRVRTELKKVFEQHELLADEENDFAKGLVVEHYPVAEKMELYADFAALNGTRRVINTIDFRVSRTAHSVKHREACAIALTHELAKDNDKKYSTETFVVFATSAASSDDIASHIAVLKKNASYLIDFSDSTRIRDLVYEIGRGVQSHSN